MMCTEQECRNDARLPWSKAIHKKMPQANILRLCMSNLQNKIDCTNQIEKKQQSLKVQQLLTPTVKKSTEILKVAQKKVQKIVKRIAIKTTDIDRGSGGGIHC